MVLDHVVPRIVLHAAIDVVFSSLCVPAISIRLPLRWPIWSAPACCAFRSHVHDSIDSSTWAMCDARQQAVNVIGISVIPSTKSLFSRRTGPAGCGLPRRSTTCCIVARI